MLTERGTLKKY